MSALDFIRISAIFVILLQLDRVAAEQNPDDVRAAKAQEMSKYMNPAAKPCDDFYEFACGNWPKHHKATDIEKVTDPFEIMTANHNKNIKKLLTTDDMKDTKVDKVIKSLYRSCLRLPATWNVYLRKLKAIVGEFGQMPALAGREWREADFDWVKTVAEVFYKYNLPIMVTALPTVDLYDNSVNCIILTSPGLELTTKAAYIDDDLAEHRSEYKDRVAYNLQRFLNMDERLAEQTAKEIVDFEIALARGLSDERLAVRRDEMWMNATVEQMHRTYGGNFDVKRFVNTSWGTLPKLSYYEDREYLQNLVKVVQRTPKKTMANYVFYQLLKWFFYDNLDSAEDMQTDCLIRVKAYFTSDLESMAYRKYVSNKTEEDLQHLWHNLKISFQDILQSTRLRWLREDTRRQAVEKVNAMTMEIVGREMTDLGPGFEEILGDERDLVDNLKTLYKSLSALNRKMLHEPAEPLDLGQDVSYTPLHSTYENRVVVPVATLQGSYFWSTAASNAFNYGKMGFLLSHELIHGFDGTGRQHDKNGNLREWWDANSVNVFQVRTKCFVNQYRNYKFDGQHLPEREEQSENIADNGGLRVAYQAYLKWYEDKSRTREELSMETYPGLQFTNKQLFFIHYAQTWCSDIELNYKRVRISTDEHTQPEFRTIGTLTNLEDFSKEFNCPVGSVMNPIKKCDIY